MVNVLLRFRALLRDAEGQDLIEYALIAGLVALVAFTAIDGAGDQVKIIWDSIESSLTTAAGQVP